MSNADTEKNKPQTMSRAIVVVALVVACLSLVVSGVLVGMRIQDDASKTTSYTLYIGLNDKDANEQLVDTEEALQTAREICIKHVGGCTISQATGYWGEDGTIYQENTIVCVVSGATQDEVNAIADEADATFNQNSVLVQRTDAVSYYR